MRDKKQAVQEEVDSDCLFGNCLQRPAFRSTDKGEPKPPSLRPPLQANLRLKLARLPITGSDVFGREEDIGFLDRAWANKDINVEKLSGKGKMESFRRETFEIA
jgi:hypothetical protein